MKLSAIMRDALELLKMGDAIHYHGATFIISGTAFHVERNTLQALKRRNLVKLVPKAIKERYTLT